MARGNSAFGAKVGKNERVLVLLLLVVVVVMVVVGGTTFKKGLVSRA